MPAQRTHEWKLVDIGAISRFRALSIVNAETIWLASMEGSVHRSADGGASWETRWPLGVEADLELRAIHAFDEQSALVLAPGPGTAARIFRTADGGSTWALVYAAESPDTYLDGLAFTDAVNGFAVGDPIDGRFTLLATHDGGQSWSPASPDASPTAIAGEGAYAASGSCIVSVQGSVWIGTGGGKHARVLRLPPQEPAAAFGWQCAETGICSAPMAGIFGLDFANEQHGIAVGGDHGDQLGDGATLALSDDGGKSWRVLGGEAPRGYRSAAVRLGIHPSTLITVGPHGSEISLDEGVTWAALEFAFNTVRAAADGTCWAAGDDGRVARLVSSASH